MNKENNKIKVLHVITRSHPFGGAQRNTWLSVRYADPRFEVSLACGEGDELPSLCKENNIPFYRIPTLQNSISPLADMKALWDLWSLIKKEKFQVVHLHSTKAGLLGRFASWLSGVPVIVFTIHGVSFDFVMRPRSAPLLLWLEKLCAGISDGIISVAESCKEDFVRRGVCKEDKIRVIYSAIEYDPIDNAVGGDAKRKELGFSCDDYIIGAVGHFRKAKGYEYLVETAPLVLKEIPKAKFIIIGDGSQREDIQNRIHQKGLHDAVRILGVREDVPEILKIMNAFVRPSIHEGLGRALTEAMYARIPCVITDIWGSGEIVEEGKTGYLVPIRDPESMAKKLIFLYNNPDKAKEIGINAHNKVVGMFGVSTMVKGIENYYIEIMEKKGKSR